MADDNQCATPLRVVRLRFSVISFADQWGEHGMASPRLICTGALVEIARILMQKRWQNSVAK